MAYSPAPIRRDSVISQAAQEICRVIGAERLSPGEALPPETRLSALLGISRNSVREALRVLHGLGYGLFLASARNPPLVAMFNQAQVARLSNVSPEHKSFYDPRHLAHHRALLRALRKRDARAARTVVRKHFQSLGLMLEFVTRTRRKPAPVLSLVPRSRGAMR